MKDNIVNTMKDKSEASISIKEVDLDEDMDMETYVDERIINKIVCNCSYRNNMFLFIYLY